MLVDLVVSMVTGFVVGFVTVLKSVAFRAFVVGKVVVVVVDKFKLLF